jgi:hypothetical protein
MMMSMQIASQSGSSEGNFDQKDGRIYASSGQDIAHWYVIAEDVGWARHLGVPVSTLTTRRYGLQL